MGKPVLMNAGCCRPWKTGVPPTWLLFAAAIVVQVGFGLYPVIVKQFAAKNNANPLIFSFYRDLLCFPVLFVCALVAERKLLIPRFRILLVLMVLGLVGMFGNQLFYILGVYLAGPDIASAFQPIIPVWTAILAVLTCIEKIPHPIYVHGWAKFIGIILAAGGAVEITVTGQTSGTGDSGSDSNGNSTSHHSHVSHYLLGCMSLFLNTICMAIYVLVQKRFIFMSPNCRWKDYPVATTAYSYFFGAMFMGLASLYYPIRGQTDVYFIPHETLYALVFAIFITSALCYLLITWTNMHLSSSIATAFWPVQVFVTGLSAWLITGDMFQPLQYLGAIMLIAGLLLVLFSNYMSERLIQRKPVLRLDACCERKLVVVGVRSSSESSEEEYKPLLSSQKEERPFSSVHSHVN